MALVYDPSTSSWSLQDIKTGKTYHYATAKAAQAAYVAHKHQRGLGF